MERASGLRSRLTPPPERRSGAPHDASRAERVLRLAVDLFGVEAAVLVAVVPDGLAVAAASSGARGREGAALDAARELVAFLDAGPRPAPTGEAQVLEELTPRGGLRAAAAVRSGDGSVIGVLCILGSTRRILLTRLQRRLLAELGDLAAVSLERPDVRRDGFGGNDDLRHLFEMCPFAMFVFDGATGAMLAVNDAAVALYGWNRPSFLRLRLDDIGSLAPAGEGADAGGTQDWTHRTRAGTAIPVFGQTIGLRFGDRAAILATVTPRSGPEAKAPARERAA